MSCSRILVVDGSAVSREIVIRILSGVINDVEITACAGGTEALEKLAEQRYDLVTTALMLADMDGLDLCRRVRHSERHQSTPVVVFSGDANERQIREGFDAGVTDYFDKSRGYPAFGQFIKAFCQRNTGVVGRVLYVEDSLTAATLTRRILERHGLQVNHVTSAEEALAILERNQDVPEEERDEEGKFDILVTDFHLEGAMNGDDLLHEVRTRLHYSRQELPVLMITGNENEKAQVAAFHAGANDFVHKPMVEEVLMARVHSLLLIRQQHDALQRQSREMEVVEATDSLTGVRNRHYLLEKGDSFYKQSTSRPFWAMVIDIDHLSEINDVHGQLVGDHILASMGELLNRLFPDGMVVRFGGEEFAILLPRAMRWDAMRRAEGLRAEVEALQPEGVPVTVSIGLAGDDDHPGADLNRLLTLADKALYVSKEMGRNCIYYLSEEGAPTPLVSELVHA
jgi:two-component system cell cycle response regulator